MPLRPSVTEKIAFSILARDRLAAIWRLHHSGQSMYHERSVVAAVVTTGLLEPLQPGSDSRLAAKRMFHGTTPLPPNWKGRIFHPPTVS